MRILTVAKAGGISRIMSRGGGAARTRVSSRRGTNASSSSKKMIQGDDARARENTCRTALSLSPTY